eukprot:CAMPEP_0194436906 /NCGR_PEP_ID=MMETSP0176-20130528/97162_1 /TAXON_ID=216777 /ORGANISM="Proboscia alata, Strain PI-D3" /LENGTH=81 /DNA_ID=CAMNT_0039257705 /DNA_START=20 /DNA_END=262 /DNA_ORIENTATION=+
MAVKNGETNKSSNNISQGLSHHASNLMENASWISKLFFSWPYPLMKLGMERPLQDADLGEIFEVDTSQYNQKYINKLWNEE